MLAPVAHIIPLTTIRRERLLPLPGRVVARLEQKVTPLDVVAEANLGREHALIDVARMLGISPREADALIKCKVGERLEAGRMVAQRTGLVPVVARVPKDGRVVAVGGGQILMETSGGTFELRAGIPGTISRLIPERGVEIIVHGAQIQGVWGNGRVDLGLMLPVMDSAGDALTFDKLDVSLRGSVLVAGTCADPQVLHTAGELPLRGLIFGTMSASLVPLALQMRYPIMVIDGFGNTPMNQAAFKLLFSNAKRDVTVSAEPYDRYTGTRPEVIIPLPISQEPGAAKEVEIFSPGQQVRIYRPPRVGEIGTIVNILPGLTTIPSGLRVQAAEIRTDEGEQTIIPLANLEVLG